jgi:hypothetical protein
MFALIPRFPDAVVGLLPVTANELTELAEHLLRFPIQLPTRLQKVCDGLDHLSVYVELQLVAGAVPDANGRGTRIAALV